MKIATSVEDQARIKKINQKKKYQSKILNFVLIEFLIKRSKMIKMNLLILSVFDLLMDMINSFSKECPIVIQTPLFKGETLRLIRYQNSINIRKN